jgi:hypothetical protein
VCVCVCVCVHMEKGERVLELARTPLFTNNIMYIYCCLLKFPFHMMFCRPIIVCLLNCVPEIVQPTEDRMVVGPGLTDCTSLHSDTSASLRQGCVRRCFDVP